MFSGTNNIMWNIPHMYIECDEYSVEYCHPHRTLLWLCIMLSTFNYPEEFWELSCSVPWKFLGIVGQDPSDSKSSRLHVDSFRFCSHSFKVYSTDSSKIVGNSPWVSSFNRFICNQLSVLPGRWSCRPIYTRRLTNCPLWEVTQMFPAGTFEPPHRPPSPPLISLQTPRACSPSPYGYGRSQTLPPAHWVKHAQPWTCRARCSIGGLSIIGAAVVVATSQIREHQELRWIEVQLWW